MDTYKQKMISYLKELSNLIKDETGIEDYFSKDDLYEVENNWTEDICERYFLVLKSLKNLLGASLNFVQLNNKSKVHPWCALLKAFTKWPCYFWKGASLCHLCGWGNRHGFCDDEKSIDSKVEKILKIKYGDIELPGLPELANKYFYGN